jgi:hypothetical protein
MDCPSALIPFSIPPTGALHQSPPVNTVNTQSSYFRQLQRAKNAIRRDSRKRTQLPHDSANGLHVQNGGVFRTLSFRPVAFRHTGL